MRLLKVKLLLKSQRRGVGDVITGPPVLRCQSIAFLLLRDELNSADK